LTTIPALLKKAKDSLHAARLLASERLFDLAVGRAYFAMHFVAEAFLLSHKLVAREPQAVLDAFGQHFDSTGELPATFHHWLVEAARLYPHVEYDTDAGITADIVTEQLDRARAFVNLGLEELADPLR
jgi:uncharacterized protein (UPF0332 family)